MKAVIRYRFTTSDSVCSPRILAFLVDHTRAKLLLARIKQCNGMWELICDQRYRWGLIAADRSGYRSDGVPQNVFVGDGGYGIRFSYEGGPSHIVIPRKAPWDTLEGIRVEIIVRLVDPHGTLISGHNCFSIYMPAPESIVATGSGGDSIDNRVTGIYPAHGPYQNITFEHIGLNAMALWIEGQLAASGPAANAIPGIGPLGVYIGAPTVPSAGQDTLAGTIYSVRIWRIDPRSMNRGFTDRTLDPDVAKCWAALAQALKDVLQDDPDCRGFLEGQVKQFLANVTAGLKGMTAADVEMFSALCREYRLLWQANMLDAPQMRELMARFIKFIKQNGLFSTDPQSYGHIINSPCFQKVLSHLPPLTCDPETVALVKFLIAELGSSP
jgi:hypothetical protein